MGIHDRKYMSDNRPGGSSPFGSSGPKTFTTKYVIVCAVVYLADSLTNSALTKLLCLNPLKVYDFEIWRLLSPFVMFSDIENMVSKILGLLIFYMLGVQFEYMLGKKNYINLIICISIGQGIVGVLIPESYNLGYFSGILSGLFVAYGLILGSQKMTLRLYFLIPLTLSGYMLIAFIVGVMIVFTLIGYFPWKYAVPIIGGCFASYVFITQYQKGSNIDFLGFFAKKAKPKNRPPARKSPAKPNAVQSQFSLVEDEDDPDDLDSYIRDKVDPILEKIATSGMGSLTAKEKKILEDAKKKMGK